MPRSIAMFPVLAIFLAACSAGPDAGDPRAEESAEAPSAELSAAAPVTTVAAVRTVKCPCGGTYPFACRICPD